jgi:predicted metal-dependent enzyme (double-stranded beta helix superfamily)
MLLPGMVERVGPELGDIHKVSNAAEIVSVSIHVYGTDIGRHPRHVYPPEGGIKPFISGYANGPDTPAFAG